MYANVFRSGDWWGITRKESESPALEYEEAIRRLPADKGPWQWHPNKWLLLKNDPQYQHGVMSAIDGEIIAAIDEQGFYVCRADPERTKLIDLMLKR
jgi:hypothetical protein